MGSVQRNPNGDCIEDTSVEQLLSPDSANMYSVFGDPEIHPRVGEQYQVEIPPLISKSQHHLYKKSPFESKSKPMIPSEFLIGLPIPIIHINKELDLENGLQLCKSAKEKKAYRKHLTKGYCLLPGLVNGSWSEIEEGCFLLGLYIFGKDLDLVKKFVEEKSLGDIQSYYYGKFYKTKEYRRWSECRKVRNRKCVYGHKLFSGMRQQELISRLFPLVSEEFQSSLSEASKSYNDGKLSLPEYVFALKAIVGTKNFIDAMAIGKGKCDLTSITMEPPKANQIAPRGKACSSLTPQEIAKFLTGGFRISKAKSNELFWEAVWPRLLARGWNSEQPKDQICSFGTKGSLVFLTPGVKRFSKRKLVKGNQYFDCVMDVLNKVALDPSLIELDSEGIENIGNNKEDGWTKETMLENDDVSSQRRHRYLQPRTPNRGKGVMKFTIVDTSMARVDGKVFRIGELTMVGNKVLNPSIVSETHSENSDSENSSQDSYIEDCDYIKKSPPICSLFQEKVTETESAMDETNDPDFEYKIPKRAREDGDLGEDKRPKKSPKYYRGLKKGDKKYLSPLAKKSNKLSSCTQISKGSDQKNVSCSEATESSEKSQTDSFSKESSFEGSQSFETNVCLEGLSNEPKSRGLIDLNFPQVSHELENGEDFATESKDDKGEQTTVHLPEVLSEFENGEVLATRSKVDKVKKVEIFTSSKYTADIISSDQVSSELENGEDFATGSKDEKGKKTTVHLPEVLSEFEKGEVLATGFKDEKVDEMKKAENFTINPRRQSMRNRPPTLKALEALANGFLTVNTRKKKKQVGPSKTTSSRPRQSPSGGMEGTEDLGNNGSVDMNMADLENVESNGDSSSFGKFHVFSDGDFL